MPHAYDLFIQIASKGTIRKKEITIANKSYFLQKLLDEMIITEREGYLLVKNTSKAKQLYRILRFCLDHNLDYSFYTKKSTLQFLECFFQKKKNILSVNIQTSIRQKLHKDSFLIYFSQKPLSFFILPHSFFEELLTYFGKTYEQIPLPRKNISDKLFKIKLLRNLPEISGFVHTSLGLEGNLLTLRQTQKILQEELVDTTVRPKDIIETQNYTNAFGYLQTVKKMTVDLILELHTIVMSHEKFSGEIREEPVHIKNNPDFQILHHKRIRSELQRLIITLNDFSKIPLKEVCKRAAFIHNQFQHIHPFLDGNSRTTRLIIQWYFNRHRMAFDVPVSCTSLYTNETKGYKTRNDSELAFVFAIILIILAQK